MRALAASLIAGALVAPAAQAQPAIFKNADLTLGVKLIQ